jgi:hypothetical protein
MDAIDLRRIFTPRNITPQAGFFARAPGLPVVVSDAERVPYAAALSRKADRLRSGRRHHSRRD